MTIGPKARRRMADVQRMRVRAALLVLTDYVGIHEDNFREKIQDAVALLGGDETIEETIGGELVIGGVLRDYAP